MVYAKNGYTPKLGDIVIISFDPSKGREIKKRRPSLVVSSDPYNKTTGMVAVCPITSTEKEHFIPLSEEHVTSGYINPLQIKTFDFMDDFRDIQYAEKAAMKELGMTIQYIEMIFDYSKIKSE